MVKVAWKESDSKIALSRRASTGTFMPVYVTNQDFTVTETNMTSSGWYITFIRSKVPSSANGVERTLTQSSQSMIWAMNPRAPSGDASSSFSVHSQRGKVNANLFNVQSAIPTNPGTTPPSSSIVVSGSQSSPQFIHGVLMFVAWAVVAPVGIMIARYLKEKWGLWWFRAHSILMGLLLMTLNIVGLVYILIGLEGNESQTGNPSLAVIHVVICVKRCNRLGLWLHDI
jgi:hypothetical protein